MYGAEKKTKFYSQSEGGNACVKKIGTININSILLYSHFMEGYVNDIRNH